MPMIIAVPIEAWHRFVKDSEERVRRSHVVIQRYFPSGIVNSIKDCKSSSGLLLSNRNWKEKKKKGLNKILGACVIIGVSRYKSCCKSKLDRHESTILMTCHHALEQGTNYQTARRLFDWCGNITEKKDQRWSLGWFLYFSLDDRGGTTTYTVKI